MARLFNVAVDIYLVDRISRDVMRIGSAFTGAERRVQMLRRALNDLQMQQGLHVQQARVMQRVAKDSDEGFARRIATMQAALNIRRAEVAESHRLERAELSRLDPLAQAIALRKQEAHEAKDAIELQRKQNVISDLQARRSHANEVAALRNAKLQNAILRDRTRIKERNLEVSEAERAARMQMIRRFAIGGAIAGVAVAALGVEAIKHAMPIQVSEQLAGEAGGFTRRQTKQLYPFALNIATQDKQFSIDDVMGAMPRLAGILHSYRLLRAVAPSMFRMAAMMKVYGAEGDVNDLVGSIAQTQRALGARTPAQYRAVNQVIGDVYKDLGNQMSPEQIATTMRAVAPALVKQPFGKGLQFAKELTLLQGLTGVKGLPELFHQLMVPGQPRTAALLSMLAPHNPRMLQQALQHGLSGQQAMQLLLHAVPGLSFPERIMTHHTTSATLYALQKAMSGGVLKTLKADMATQQSSRVLLAKALQTTTAAVTGLTKAIDNVLAVVGKEFLKPTQAVLGGVINTLNASTSKKHPTEYLLAKYNQWQLGLLKDFFGWVGHLGEKGAAYVVDRAGHNLKTGAQYVLHHGIPLYTGPAGHDLPPHLRPAGHSEVRSAAAAHANSAGDTIVHHTTHVHVDGKTLATASEKYRVRSARDNLKASLNSKASGHGTLVHPAVATGNP
jgi:hypothetical protein